MINNENNKNILKISQDKIEELVNRTEKYENIKLESVENVLTPEELNKISSSILEGGKLEINFSNNFLTKEDDILKLISNLKLAGFLKVERKENNVEATKKTWNKSKNKKSDNPWKAMKIEEKSDLVLEDELVDPFDSYQKFAKVDDCITKPKPCKNCNCGRADAENQDKQSAIDPNFKSDCGKCFLGDAFRCAGCPYRGLPAFEPGDKIEFKDTTTTENKVEEEKTGVNIKNKKVKIDI
jgi:hypothetical protein